MTREWLDYARAALVHEVLKRFAAKLPVEWYEDGLLRRATPRDDKYEGAWLVCSNGWEQYYRGDLVAGMLRQAGGIPFSQFEEGPQA